MEVKIERAENGRLYQVRGSKRCVIWTPQMEADMRRFFPTSSNEEMAGILGITISQVSFKANKMNLHKDREYMQVMLADHARRASAASNNKGRKRSREFVENLHRKRKEWLQREKEKGTYIHQGSIPVYCVEDKQTYPSIKHFLIAKGLFDKNNHNIYSIIIQTGQYMGFNLIKKKKR
ncbi:MAG: hypothetical protein ACI36Z_10050 [Alloprevotella sp.]